MAGTSPHDIQKSAVAKNNDFAFNFFRSVSQSEKQKGKSTVVSPLSVTYVLGMLNTGATGNTSREITTLLGFNNSDSKSINELCQQLINGAPTVDEYVKVGLANCVVVDNKVALLSEYQKEVTDYYNAEAATVPFGTKEAVDFVNNWSSQHTEGLIPQLVENLDGVMALINAVYINAPWTEPFHTLNTVNEKFTKEDGNDVTVPMMHGKHLASTSYAKTNDYEALRMAYGTNNNWAMYVLLPSKGKSVDDVISKLTSESWAETLRGMAGRAVEVKLPKFKTELDLNLNKILSQMGAPSMFNPLQELTLISSNYKDLYVSMVKQKATIEVKEEGTEAAAVTIMGMVGDSGETITYYPFFVDRPFVYLIQEASSGAIFFIGTYRGN